MSQTQETSSTDAPLMEVRIIPVTPLMQNCSLIWETSSRKAAFVDPGGDIDQLIAALEQFDLTLDRIWLTHGHMDHAGAAQDLKERFNVPIEGPHEDDQWLLDTIEEMGARFGIQDGRNTRSDRYLKDGDSLQLGELSFGVVHTPGHTPGHVVIHHQDAKIAFVGDVLFQGSIGRTDFPRGDHATLINSITTKLWPLGNEIRFIPGHGNPSSFGQERLNNPFVSDSALGRA